MLDTVNTGWENGNALQVYPFMDNSSMQSIDGDTLPSNYISDLLIFSPNDILGIYLSSFRIGPRVVGASFSSSSGGVCSVFVSKDTFVPYSPVKMSSAFGVSSGYITFGDIAWPETPKLYRFTSSATQVDPRAIVQIQTPGVKAFKDDNSGVKIDGVVELSIPATMTATVLEDYGTWHVAFNLTSSGVDEVATPCTVGNSTTACGTPAIKSINGVAPNSSGEILLGFL